MKAPKYRALEDDELVCDDADDSVYEYEDLDGQQWLDSWWRRAHLDEDAWLERELQDDF